MGLHSAKTFIKIQLRSLENEIQKYKYLTHTNTIIPNTLRLIMIINPVLFTSEYS